MINLETFILPSNVTILSFEELDDKIVFTLAPASEAVPAEAYTLSVTPEVVRVEASGLRGFAESESDILHG